MTLLRWPNSSKPMLPTSWVTPRARVRGADRSASAPPCHGLTSGRRAGAAGSDGHPTGERDRTRPRRSVSAPRVEESAQRGQRCASAPFRQMWTADGGRLVARVVVLTPADPDSAAAHTPVSYTH